MNNKGFAITGIIYASFVLFLIILLSILGNLKFKNRLLEKTVLSYDENYECDFEEMKETVADGTGIYKYYVRSTTNECYTYLKKADSLVYNKDNIKFSTYYCQKLVNMPDVSFEYSGKRCLFK